MAGLNSAVWKHASAFSDFGILTKVVMAAESDVKFSIPMKPLLEGSESNGSSITLEGSVNKNGPDETLRSHVGSETPASMTNTKMVVLVGILSVAIIVVLPLCVMNHIKLQTLLQTQG